MDLKHGSVPEKSRHAIDFILRLDRTGSQSKSPHRQKLKKRKTENVETIAANGPTVGRPGPVFRRRVPYAEKEIPMERKVNLEPGQKVEAKSYPNQLGHRLGGSGFGLERSLAVVEGKPSNDGQKRAEGGRWVPLSFGHVFKRVRFAPSLVSATSVGNIKRPAFRKLNINETASKFYEGFGSKASTAVS